MAGVEEVEVVVAHHECATLRVGDMFLKIDVRMLHDAPLPPWPGRGLDEIASHLDGECEWIVTNGVLPTEVMTRNRQVAEAALRPWTPVFTHGDLQVAHVFVEGDEITGVLDWSEAGCEFDVLRSRI